MLVCVFVLMAVCCRFLNPLGMLLGGTVVSLVFMGSVWAGENKTMIKNFKKKNPSLFIIVVLGASYFLLSLCGGVLVFIFGITFPLLCEYMHLYHLLFLCSLNTQEESHLLVQLITIPVKSP